MGAANCLKNYSFPIVAGARNKFGSAPLIGGVGLGRPRVARSDPRGSVWPIWGCCFASAANDPDHYGITII